MSFLNFWVFFGFIPLFFLYKRHNHTRQTKLLFITIICIFIAIARPVLKHKPHQSDTTTHDYIIALDVSYSMQATDLKPTRYEKAKEAILTLFTLHPTDRFTLFAFSANPLLLSPPTTDTTLIKQTLNLLNPAYILSKSTNITSLLEAVAHLPMEEKNLILFTDGGEQTNLQELVHIAKKHSIKIFTVATATKKGTTLQQGNKLLKTAKNQLVISKCNPLLEPLAIKTGAYPYTLTSKNELLKLSNDLKKLNAKKTKVTLLEYTELFFIPLFFALIAYMGAITKLHQLFSIIMLFIVLNPPLNASFLDFYYEKEAHKAYNDNNYTKALNFYKKLTPSPQSYYNIANGYYKLKRYKTALQFYSQIATTNKQLKHNILYNMGNCAVALKHYEKAQLLYIQSLTLFNDSDVVDNLHNLQKYLLKKRKKTAIILPHKKKSTLQNKHNNTRNTNKSKKSSNKNTTKGMGEKSLKSSVTHIKKIKKSQQNRNYRFSYKAYEYINKGYTNETKPW